MKETEALEIQGGTLDQIYAHAKVEFPDECCGIILGDGTQEFVRKCRNVQNEYHAKDPDKYPRDARTAYLIAEDDLNKIHQEARDENRQIKVLYHSHPNHDAYFSEKDKADATWGDWGPTYPGAVYLVVSIYDREVKTVKAFAWNEADTDFVEVPIHTNRDT